MLQPAVFGLNYQTADFDLRDRLAFASGEIPEVLQRLINSGVVREALLLSTCNRTELYCIANDIDFVINSLCAMHDVCPRTVARHSYVYHGDDCVRHLFRVISGLESMVLGETEIVAQIKTAMDIAEKCSCLGSHLSGLFQQALAVEKEVRNHTEINNVAISMGHAVVNYVEAHLDKLTKHKVLFVGAGQMMQQIAPHFNFLSWSDILVLNRTPEHAKAVADKISGNIGALGQLSSLVNDYDVVVLCCASNQPLLTLEMLQPTIANNGYMLIIDLSMPLVISREIAKQANFEVVTVDEVAKLVDVGLERRRQAAAGAEEIIALKLQDYQNWLRRRSFAPIIKKLREQSESIRLESLAAAVKQLQNGDDPSEILKQFSVQLTNRLLHTPTVMIAAHQDSGQDLAGMVSYLYDLE